MWPFKRKTSAADVATELAPELVLFAAEKWRYFTDTLPMKPGTPLIDQLYLFSVPATEGMKKAHPKLENSPDAFFMMICAAGIVKSGTHTKQQVEDELGTPLPDGLF